MLFLTNDFSIPSSTQILIQIYFHHVSGTRNSSLIPDELGGRWEEYEFHCKPGDVSRRPCIISPYHYRLDWLMWFAAFQVIGLSLDQLM